MRQVLHPCVVRCLSIGIFLFFSVHVCNGQNKAMEDQKKAFAAMKNYIPGSLPPSGSIYMKADINGQPWSATQLIPDPDSRNSYHVNGEKDGVRIAFYVVGGSNMRVGYTKKFTEDFVADFMYTDDVVFYGGRSGSYTITRVDDDGFEASFHFNTGSGKEKVFDVTGGTLRFPFYKKK